MIDKMKVYKDTELSHKAILVYFYLCDRSNSKTKGCYPSTKTISKDLNLSLSSVKRSLNELIKNNYIEKENRVRDNGGKTSNMYYIL